MAADQQRVELSHGTVQVLIDYLVTKPFREVLGLVSGLQDESVRLFPPAGEDTELPRAEWVHAVPARLVTAAIEYALCQSNAEIKQLLPLLGQLSQAPPVAAPEPAGDPDDAREPAPDSEGEA